MTKRLHERHHGITGILKTFAPSHCPQMYQESNMGGYVRPIEGDEGLSVTVDQNVRSQIISIELFCLGSELFRKPRGNWKTWIAEEFPCKDEKCPFFLKTARVTLESVTPES